MNVRAGRSACGLLLEAQVEREDVEHVEVLPLVFVQALDLDVEERLGVHLHAGALLDEGGEAALGRELHRAPLLLELRVVRQRLQFAELVEVAQPAVADAVGDELGEGRIADGHEPARGDAVGDVAELLRPELGEVAHHRLLEQLGVQPRDAVDAVAADGGEIGHAHIPRAALVNERHPRHAAFVAREAGADLVEEAAVDFSR